MKKNRLRDMGFVILIALLVLLATAGIASAQDENEGQENLKQTLENIRNLLLAIGGVAGAIGYIFVGFKWMQSGGNAEERIKAKDYLKDVTIGVFLIFASGIIVQAIMSTIVV